MFKAHQTPGRRARSLRHRRDGERGQSLVEFAFTAPILIFALLGLAELGSALNSYLTLVNASRDGARLYSQGDATEATILVLVANETDRLTSNIPTGSENAGTCSGDDAGVCITPFGTPPNSNASVTVKVCYDHPVIIGIPILLPGPVKMCSTTVMRLAI